jgi:Arc/MetJ-type ribon-helix-helix transcriptional regulator
MQSVDAMLEALQRSSEDKEKKLEEQDEALIKSLFGGPRGELIQRIDDDVFEDDDDDDFFETISDNGETSSNK